MHGDAAVGVAAELGDQAGGAVGGVVVDDDNFIGRLLEQRGFNPADEGMTMIS
jgi:hypothetical protein